MSAPRMVSEREAGRELDALVAEKVMGDVAWDVVIEGCSRGGMACPTFAAAGTYRDALERAGYTVGDIVLHGDVPAYSTDIAAAWRVVEKLCDRFRAVLKSPFEAGDDFFAGFTALGASAWNRLPDFAASAETAPLAICRAALLAVADDVVSGRQP